MLAIILMALGLIGTVISFGSAPKTLDEAKEILAKQEAAHHGHGGGHATETHSSDTKEVKHEEKAHDVKVVEEATKETATTHANDSLKGEAKDAEHATAHKEEATNEAHHAADSTSHKEEEKANAHQEADTTTHTEAKTEEHHVAEIATAHKEEVSEAHHAAYNDTHATASHHGEDHGDAHAEHVFHQMQNRPWSAVYVSLLFFLGISLLVMAFYAAQRVAQAGWSIVLFRVMEAITVNLHYIGAFMLVFIILTAMHANHLFSWMTPGTFDLQSPNYDPIVDAKKWWMNMPGWVMRSVFYLLVWNAFRFIIRRKSIEQDNGDLKLHKRIYNISVGFIVVFMITESMMSWDWIMGIDPHWFSTLFGWYVLATFLVSALTVICLVTLYLRGKGYLPLVNDSHIHDLAKFMFGFSVFWTYLWFAQFMLIWYADMPEETVYYVLRFKEYIVPFMGMVALNFIFPILLLINSDFKTVPWIIVIAGMFILVGHYVDLFVMIMPGTVGDQWGFGVGEISAFLFFLGVFIFGTFTAFGKANPVPKGNPYLHESETHHYYIIEHKGEDNAHH
ncbi:transporter permease [Tenacibaculum amylolyticum]|uniref:quinol:cytochrome C oxidoreductase n=1 Tax=Tenacibaculum amylolyticum TaxID=104269 RepID=UPI0038B56C03